MKRLLQNGEKPLIWTGPSYRNYVSFPEQVQDVFGHALGLAQLGGKHPIAKPWKGEGPGVFELAETYEGNTYRAIYTVRFERAMYVLHAFQKKSTTGIKTGRNDIAIIHARLKAALTHYKEFYGEDE